MNTADLFRFVKNTTYENTSNSIFFCGWYAKVVTKYNIKIIVQ